MGSRSHDAASIMPPSQCGVDGALDRVLRLAQKQRSMPAIFIHAGAGFHSHQNERVHIKACVSAAQMGMQFLKAGATATEAIEAALRILEDKEITNAGFGSNLSIDGTVECDATIVDHLGRSGACGAVPSWVSRGFETRATVLTTDATDVRNPISLAKLILDTSNMPLSLRRVPPNVLVGEGARLFAEEHGMPTFANEHLVSKNSHDRFFRWQEDLMRAEGRTKDPKLNPPLSKAMACVPCQYDTAAALDPLKPFPRDHTAAIQAGTWNEGQTDSPYAGTPLSDVSTLPESAALAGHSRHLDMPLPPVSRSPLPMPMLQMPLTPCSFPEINKYGVSSARVKTHEHLPPVTPPQTSEVKQGDLKSGDDFDPIHEGSATVKDHCATRGALRNGVDFEHETFRHLERPDSAATSSSVLDDRSAKRPRILTVAQEDLVTDTIGAIAIDEHGLIAAGSSSGGIGMKHRGRLGPAALVGIGTAVVPCADKDDEGVTVAAVTSGTGEHMATTMASQRCAERLYQGTRRGPQGFDIEECDENAIMESFISDDFMNHPGVRHCRSAGAIGVMAVKKCRAGYHMYFAHNTDSFALASMGGLDKEPRCTMSRLSEGSKIALGGRKIQTV